MACVNITETSFFMGICLLVNIFFVYGLFTILLIFLAIILYTEKIISKLVILRRKSIFLRFTQSVESKSVNK